MVADLIRALLGAAAAAVLPGYFWAAVLRPTSGLAERLTYSTVLSMATVPVITLVLTQVTGGGVTLWIAVTSAALVFGSGALVWQLKGGAPGQAVPLMPRPGAIRDPRLLVALAGVFVAVLYTTVLPRPPMALLLVVAAGLIVTGFLVGRATVPGEPAGRGGEGGPVAGTGHAPAVTPTSAAPAIRAAPRWARGGALAVVVVVTGIRSYGGVLAYDWPSIRGGDHFSHAVMAEQMLAHGNYSTYLLYPPGLPTLTAVISRICGLPPLTLFPVLAPALLVLTALAAYALATRLWGWEYGVVAAALAGMVLTGAYSGFAEGRYPDLIAAFFLITMAVTALFSAFESPSLRSGALVTVTAASVVLYHSVASMYIAILLALVTVTALPYLLYKRKRREARNLLVTLAAVAVVAACYAAYIYNLATLLTGHSTTDKAVAITLGSQPTQSPQHLLTELSPMVVWLGLAGVAALTMTIRRLARPPQVLAAVTLVMWCVLMYIGSRTSLDGFPHRFERDLGAPLSVTAALIPGVIIQTLRDRRVSARALAMPAAAVTASVVGLMMVVETMSALIADVQPVHGLPTPQVVAAGRWLAAHNTGGNIISTHEMNRGVSNRGVLAMGGYAGLQSYRAYRVAHPRSLPPAGRQILLDSQEVLLHPQSCQSASILAHQDVRYVVLYRLRSSANLAGFQADPARYHRVYENPSVIIYAPTHASAPCVAAPASTAAG